MSDPVQHRSPTRRRLLAALAAPALVPSGARPAGAQGAPAWPERPVRIVVPFAPGGNTDGLARLSAELLTRRLGGVFTVDNRPGGGGMIANETVARAAPDGYTLMMGAMPNIAIAPAAIVQRTPFDPAKAFTPVVMVGTNPFVLMVHAAVPARTTGEFIALMRAADGAMPYASGGMASLQHLTMLLFMQRAGIAGVHVPYRGGAPALSDLTAGAVPSLFANISEALGQRDNPAVRLLAVTGAARAPQLPEVPTVAESALPGFETVTWNGLLGPAGLPDAIVQRIAGSLASFRDDPAVQGRFAQLGTDFRAGTPEEFAARVRGDIVTWGEVIRTSGVRID